ncbi:MAG: hypothetical protein GY906_11615 [bacterium]|nr:hypothetical protein [bacterium]
MIEEGIVSALASLADAFPGNLPQGTDAGITYKVVSKNREMSHDGPTGDVTARIQLTIHEETHLKSTTLGAAVVNLMNGRTEPLGAQAVDLVEVANDFDLEQLLDTENWQYVVDLIIKYKEA